MPSARSVLAPVTVTAVGPISPTFVRVEFSGPALADLGTAGPVYDQRVKLIFPAASGQLPRLNPTDDWYGQWLGLPESERGAIRTYSIRDLYGEGADRRLVVDFVLHLQPGATGPASSWASRASVGDQIIVVGPRRGVGWGGIEFAPGTASRILLAGDETAVPAMTRILADLPAEAVGHAYLEVPHQADVLAVEAPAGFTLHWLPRGPAPVGTQLVAAVLGHFSATVTAYQDDPDRVDDVETTVWETPTFSGSGEQLTSADEIAVGPPADGSAGGPPVDGIAGGLSADEIADVYAWVAGESGVVTTIRRGLVNDVGFARGQVAFMGYWRLGVAMRG